MRPSIPLLEDLVGRFLCHCRPRGKPLPKCPLAHVNSIDWVLVNEPRVPCIRMLVFQCMQYLGEEIKTEAWVLRHLVTTVAGAARRPHIPRSNQMKGLFKLIGIEFPETDDGALDLTLMFLATHIHQH